MTPEMRTAMHPIHRLLSSSAGPHCLNISAISQGQISQGQSNINRLKEGALFEELAKTNSACPSRKNGGSLGQLTSGQTVPEFERQVFSMTEGLAPHPIETRYGYHLVRIDRRIEGRPLDYEHVKDKVRNYLNTRVQRKAVSQYIQHLVDQAKIEGIELDQCDSPLMQ